MSRIAIIAALSTPTRAIGKDNQLLWSIPDDLKRFKALTTGHPVIMGRKTWESLPERARPLPQRTNIVVSRTLNYDAPGATVSNSLDQALVVASTSPGSDEIFIIGGAQLYEEALDRADILYLTLVDDEKEGDVYFPPYEQFFTKILAEESREWSGLPYQWVDIER